MLNSFIHAHELSVEDREKAGFLMDTKHILQQVESGTIPVNKGYDMLIELLGERELTAVLHVLYKRAVTKRKNQTTLSK